MRAPSSSYLVGMAKVSARKKAEDQEWRSLNEVWDMATSEHCDLQAGAAFYLAIEKIAVLYEAHEADWPAYLTSNGIKPNPKKPFRPLIVYLMCGRVRPQRATSKSWISKIAATLDEWREVLRDQEHPDDNVTAEHFEDYLASFGGVQEVYQSRRDRLHGDRPKKPPRPSRKELEVEIARLQNRVAELEAGALKVA